MSYYHAVVDKPYLGGGGHNDPYDSGAQARDALTRSFGGGRPRRGTIKSRKAGLFVRYRAGVSFWDLSAIGEQLESHNWIGYPDPGLGWFLVKGLRRSLSAGHEDRIHRTSPPPKTRRTLLR
jgi:hypothetical protein